MKLAFINRDIIILTFELSSFSTIKYIYAGTINYINYYLISLIILRNLRLLRLLS